MRNTGINKNFTFIFSFLLIVIFSFSCTIVKKRYSKGYFISWKKHKEAPSQKYSPLSKDLTASSEKGIKLLTSEDLILNPGDSCDTIVFKNKMEMKAKVLEISPQEIKYKRCDLLDGPTYTVSRDHVELIKYKNGFHEKIETERVYSQQQTQPQTYSEPIHLSDSCALIVLSDSTLIKGRIVEIRNDVIRYRYCSGQTKNIFAVKRSLVTKVLLGNGTIDVLKESEKVRGESKVWQGRPRTHGSALVSMILGIVSAVESLGLLENALLTKYAATTVGSYSVATFLSTAVIYAVPAILALIFAYIALKKINEAPEKHKGKKMAQVGILLAGIFFAVLIISLAIVL